MVDMPEKWQLRELVDVIAASPLQEEGFQFTRVERGGRINTAFRFMHEAYPKAFFFAEWMSLRDPMQPSGKGGDDYHVEMAPGRGGPYEKENYITWRSVVEYFHRWIDCLAREFAAGEEWGEFVQLPRIPPPSIRTNEPFQNDEVRSIDSKLDRLEKDLATVIEQGAAARRETDDLREWLREELSEVHEELRRQSKRGFRRTMFGFGASLAMTVGPTLWAEMSPIFRDMIQFLDSVRAISSGE